MFTAMTVGILAQVTAVRWLKISTPARSTQHSLTLLILLICCVSDRTAEHCLEGARTSSTASVAQKTGFAFDAETANGDMWQQPSPFTGAPQYSNPTGSIGHPALDPARAQHSESDHGELQPYFHLDGHQGAPPTRDYGAQVLPHQGLPPTRAMGCRFRPPWGAKFVPRGSRSGRARPGPRRRGVQKSCSQDII